MSSSNGCALGAQHRHSSGAVLAVALRVDLNLVHGLCPAGDAAPKAVLEQPRHRRSRILRGSKVYNAGGGRTLYR